MAVPEASVNTIVIFYPSDSLRHQLERWAARHPSCSIESSEAKSALDIREAMGHADFVLIDSTEDHAQAIDAFTLAVVRFGTRRAIVYSERMHDGLEMFVRMRGADLLFGPLAEAQWEGLFMRNLFSRGEAERGRIAA